MHQVEKAFTKERVRKAHADTKHNGKPRVSCKYKKCPCTTNDYGNYTFHLYQVHKEESEMKCSVCQSKFENERVFGYHMEHRENTRNFQCNFKRCLKEKK